MTGRTHDLAAFTALNFIVATQPLGEIALSTAFVAFGANFLGGLAPDLDQPTSSLWRNIRGGSVISRLIAPIFGGHRYISHSLIGVFLWGYALRFLFSRIKHIFLIDFDSVWWAFMIGYVSHLLIDMITKEGVPWLFPIPWKIGIPPFQALRIKTGGIVETSIIFPGLIVLNGYMFYAYYSKYIDLLRHYIK